ncbi:MAG: protein ImuA [Maricaulis maris]|jgi:protein ImuA
MMSPPRPETLSLSALRQRLATLDPAKPGHPGQAGAEDGPNLPCARPGQVVELRPQTYFDTPASLCILAGMSVMASHQRQGPVLWCRRRADPRQDFGDPYPHGLQQWGIDPSRILLALARDQAGVLWAMEEGARAPELAAIVGETGSGHAYGLTPSRRLQLAAEKHDTAVLLLRPFDDIAPSAARQRWRIAAAPGPAAPWTGARGLPAPGARRWQVCRERGRNGREAGFTIEWNDEALCFRLPALVAEPTSRPQHTPAGAERIAG